MKICDVTQFYSPVGGGVRRYITEKRNYIQQKTQDEHLLIIPGNKTEVIREGRLTTCKIKSPSVNKTSRYRILFNLKQVEKFILTEKPDLIESGDPYHLGWRSIRLGKKLNIPVFGFYHSHFPEAYLRTIFKYGGARLAGWMMQWAKRYVVKLYNRYDMTFVPSEFLAQLLREWGVRNTQPVHLGVDIQTFNLDKQPQFTKQKLNLPEDSFLLLYIGRLSGEKNTALLLETFELLQQKHPGKFSFLIIGDGQLRDLVIKYRSKLPLLRWIPYCKDSEELADYYRISDLFVHPGVCETFGLVALESQACGCPVVGIKGSYMDANIFAGHHLWSPKNSAETLAEAIWNFYHANPKKLGREASQSVIENFAWEKIFKHLWLNYHKVLKNRNPIRA